MSNAAALEKLRKLFPWPKEKPQVPPRDHGWFNGRRDLPQFCNDKQTLIIEVGTWMGKSAKFWLNSAPNAHLICIDTWAGSEEHHKKPETAKLLPTLYETCQVNLWPWRDRCTMVRLDSAEGLHLCGKELGLRPDLVYIDAAHDAESVFTDLNLSLEGFPGAQITGDDWPWGGVQEGVKRSFQYNEIPITRLKHQGRTWWISKEA
jgi:hypothetical protein